MDMSEHLKKLAQHAKKESVPAVEVTHDVLRRIRRPLFRKNRTLPSIVTAAAAAAAVGGIYAVVTMLSISDLLIGIGMIQDPFALLSVLFGGVLI